MKLFEPFDTYTFQQSVYPNQCREIWTRLTALGKPLFGKRELEDLWRDFSKEKYCVGFMMKPNDILVEEFANWLVEKEKEINE